MRSIPLPSALLQPAADDLIETQRPATAFDRLEVCPPRAIRDRPWLAVVRDWFGVGWSRPAPAGPVRGEPGASGLLQRVRADFIEAVDDLDTPAADDLLDRIHFARGLRELWHLRTEVFRLVSLHHSQAEADERLAWLNRHFPTRSPRSGFGALGSPTSRDMWP
jgi:hypothetical protein